MKVVDLKSIELNDFVARDNKNQKCSATFPMFGLHGTESTATVYFELEPGKNLGRHTDSCEEILLIAAGEVEITVGKETIRANEGNMALVPVMVPHDIKNVGETKAKVLGFFGGANNIVATFDNEWLPTESNYIDTSLLA